MQLIREVDLGFSGGRVGSEEGDWFAVPSALITVAVFVDDAAVLGTDDFFERGLTRRRAQCGREATGMLAIGDKLAPRHGFELRAAVRLAASGMRPRPALGPSTPSRLAQRRRSSGAFDTVAHATNTMATAETSFTRRVGRRALPIKALNVRLEVEPRRELRVLRPTNYWHAPASQCWPPVHTVAQCPQFASSVRSDTSHPSASWVLQSAKPSVHAVRLHAPHRQMRPALGTDGQL